MATERKVHAPTFEAQVALAAVRGDRTANELAAHLGVHPTLPHAWKEQLSDGAEGVSANGAKAAAPSEGQSAELSEPIGRLKVELDRVKKGRRRSADRLRPPIEAGHPELGVRRQCQLLGVTRSGLYYTPAAETPEDLGLMRLMDRQSTARPSHGSRRMAVWLRSQGHRANRERARRLLGAMGLEAIHPRPRRRGSGRPHRVLPYLLRGAGTDRPDQAWGADSTYLPVVGGFTYLAAAIGWYSRFAVAWRLSNAPGGALCRGVLGEALTRGRPEVLDTDQGVRFTAGAWATRVEAAGAAVSTGGRGRAADDVLVERRWRSAKYEGVYPRGYESVPDLERGLGAYFAFYNHERFHQSLGYETPAEGYRGGRVGRAGEE